MQRGARVAVDVAEADFVRFVGQHSDALHRTAYLLTGRRDQAEDVVQTALTRLYLAWDRRAEWDDPLAFARRIVSNVFLSSVRRRWWGERPQERLPERGDPAPDSAAAVAERDALRRGLLALPVRQRTALVLRYYADLSEADTATALGCAVGTVKSLTSRGLAALRLYLEEVA